MEGCWGNEIVLKAKSRNSAGLPQPTWSPDQTLLLPNRTHETTKQISRSPYCVMRNVKLGFRSGSYSPMTQTLLFRRIGIPSVHFSLCNPAFRITRLLFALHIYFSHRAAKDRSEDGDLERRVNLAWRRKFMGHLQCSEFVHGPKIHPPGSWIDIQKISIQGSFASRISWIIT
jgi:hypothetical protein